MFKIPSPATQDHSALTIRKITSKRVNYQDIEYIMRIRKQLRE